MYLLTAEECAATLSNQVPGNGMSNGGIVVGAAGSLDKYASPLQLIKTRCEELLEISSFDRASRTDHFVLTSNTEHTLRLTEGFLYDSASTLIIKDSTGAVVDADASIDDEKGLVWVTLPAGKYTVTYYHGFDIDTDKVYVDLPDWLKSIAKYAMNLHYRLTSMVEKTPENVSYGDLQPAVRAELFTRVTKRYQRDRVGVTFPRRTVSNG